jgi:hypothetical protein
MLMVGQFLEKNFYVLFLVLALIYSLCGYTVSNWSSAKVITNLRIKPRIFIGSFLITTLFIVVAGTVVANTPYLSKIQRFHPHVAPESFYYPTFNSMLNSVKANAGGMDRTIVIIGGSSGFYGVGQSLEDTISTQLQDLLGDSFYVANLAFRGGGSIGQGALVAEALLRQNYKVIYLGDAQPGGVSPLNTTASYEYFYWEARHSGKLFKSLARDNYVRSIKNSVQGREIAAIINKFTHGNDFWNYISYKFVGVFVNPYDPFRYPFTPREFFTDSEVSASPAESYPEDMQAEKALFTATAKQVFTKDQWNFMLEQWDASLPFEVRRNFLFLIGIESPKIREMVSTTLNLSWIEQRNIFASVLKTKGINAVTMGEDFVIDDYIGRPHYSKAGATKVAQILEKQVRLFKTNLGY